MRRTLSSWAGPLSIAGAFALLAWWSWGKWTDVQIDFGVELYIPWQLSQGKAPLLAVVQFGAVDVPAESVAPWQ